MKALVGIILFLFTISACSGSGGFTNGFRLGKKTEKKDGDGNTNGENLGKESNGTAEDDSADQPVQITGVYLTCSETESRDTQATFGCRLARKDNGKTVSLSDLGSDWVFDNEILNSLPGSVLTKKIGESGLYQVLYEFEASSRAVLKKLIENTRIGLNIELLPGVGIESGMPEFSGLIITFVPPGQSEVVNGSQNDLSDNIVDTQAPASATPVTQSQVANPPAGNPSVTPTPATNPPVVSGPDPVVPSTGDPAAQSAAAGGPADSAGSPAADPAVSEKDPVVTFSLVVKSPGVFALNAAFDQTAGLSEANFGSGTNAVSFIGALIGASGSATLGLTTPVSVSVKKGKTTCTGSDTIGAGKISLPLICK